jgi:hypothetical protein
VEHLVAIDTETKRVSTLNISTHHPGHWFGPSEPDGSDLDDSNQRGFVLWHYAGIAANPAEEVVAAGVRTDLGHRALFSLFQGKRKL